MDEILKDKSTWIVDLVRRARERFPELDQCGKTGKIAREERFWVSLASRKDGTPEKTSILTTMNGCGVADCVAKKLDGLRRDPWPGDEDPNGAFEVFLRPDLPPRNRTAQDPLFDLQTATRCGPAGSTSNVTKVSGRLAPEVIQRVIRSNYGKFRSCYEAGLGRNPNLEGRVNIRFVIERDGSVSKAQISENTLTDCKVAACIRDEYPKLTFPAPDGGIVTVVYPIMLEPG